MKGTVAFYTMLEPLIFLAPFQVGAVREIQRKGQMNGVCKS